MAVKLSTRMIVETIATGAALTAAGKIKEDSLLGMLYKDTLQPSVQSLGRALGATIEFCTTPILLCKYGSEAAKLNYQKHLDNYARKIKDIPGTDTLPVNPQIGVPILERLAYTTNDEIADLFTSLLAKASSNTSINEAHPAYIHLIDRLSIDEAKILKALSNKDFIPSISIRAYVKEGKGFSEIVDNGVHIEAELLFQSNTSTYLNNLKSLGIIDNTHGKYKIDESIYEPLFKMYQYDSLNKQLIDGGVFKKLEKKKSYYQVTPFGKSFIKACLENR